MTQETPVVREQQYGTYASGEEEHQITDEMLELARSRTGAELPSLRDGWNTRATQDAIRHYAQAMGIDDPLYSDPHYAATTRWGGVIAPPTFFRTLKKAVKQEWSDEQRACS